MPKAGVTSAGRLQHNGTGQAVGEANPHITQDVLQAFPRPGAHRKGTSLAGHGDSKVPGRWQGKQDVGQSIKQPWEGITTAPVLGCSTEPPALMALPSSAGLSDELQRQVCFVLLWSLQVGLSLSRQQPWPAPGSPGGAFPDSYLGTGLGQSLGCSWGHAGHFGVLSSYFLVQKGD